MRDGRIGMNDCVSSVCNEQKTLTIIDVLQTPVFVCDMAQLESNLKILESIERESGLRILLALKGFNLPETFALIARYLEGTSASSYNEVRLSHERLGKEIHSYLPAFKESEIDAIAEMSDTVIFNSLSQYEKFYARIEDKCSCGLRINLEIPFELPQHCNPNRKKSRLGVLADNAKPLPKGIEGLHVHALCSQKSDAFEILLATLQTEFSQELKSLKWINFGGGHALTCKDYDREHLIRLIQTFRQNYPHLKLYMEPSEAVVHDSGVLIASVLDIVHNEIDIAILDISIEVHLLDVLITKQAPVVCGAVAEGAYAYQLAGISCAAGDILGHYCFETPLKVGDRIVFENQMAYSMVKSTFFNGINPADIAIKNPQGEISIVKKYSYEAFLHRM